MLWRSSGRTGCAVIVTLDFPTSDLAEFVGRLACDAVAVDLEHDAVPGGRLSDLARACEVAGVDLVARLPAREDLVQRAVDAGIRRLQLTQIQDVEEVDAVIRWCSFPPDGSRGISRARVNSFGHHDGGYPALIAATREAGFDLIVQVETVRATQQITEIAARAWVRCIVIGAHDLAASAGRPGQPSHPDVVDLVDRAVSDVRAAGVELALSASSPADADAALRRGADVVLASQARLISNSLTALTSALTLETS